MRSLLVIGIGAGDPDFVTVQAIDALNRVDVFFLLDKPQSRLAATDLNALREQICARYVREPRYRTVTVLDPPRQRVGDGYPQAVEDWRADRAAALEGAIASELDDGGCGGLLVWGDPCLYDSTIAVIDHIQARGAVELDYEVVPGISSIQALAARHRLTINRVGQSVHVTTGRRLAEGLPDDVDDIVVLLDADLACADLPDDDLDIYWGAYLGTPEEILIAGRLGDVVGEIRAARTQARARKGWIMDCYLLRRKRRGAVDDRARSG